MVKLYVSPLGKIKLELSKFDSKKHLLKLDGKNSIKTVSKTGFFGFFRKVQSLFCSKSYNISAVARRVLINSRNLVTQP